MHATYFFIFLLHLFTHKTQSISEFITCFEFQPRDGDTIDWNFLFFCQFKFQIKIFALFRPLAYPPSKMISFSVIAIELQDKIQYFFRMVLCDWSVKKKCITKIDIISVDHHHHQEIFFFCLKAVGKSGCGYFLVDFSFRFSF